VPGWQSRLETIPLLRPLLERLYKKRFPQVYGGLLGVFANFDQARRSAPPGKPLGFANQGYVQAFTDRRSQIFSFDYPILFWLARLLRGPARLFDYGGHCGTHFYAYSRYLDYPAGFRWTVCDLPEIIRAGRQIAADQGAKTIEFTERFADADGADILLAAGSLQYIEAPVFSGSLAQLKSLPKHILLNKLPVYDGPGFVTLQNGGVAFHPMYVFNRQQFIESISALGYQLTDDWSVPSHGGRIPFHPEASFPAHSGLYFTLR
jgi:putative methyltransferase (TIGR04325 family)